MDSKKKLPNEMDNVEWLKQQFGTLPNGLKWEKREDKHAEVICLKCKEDPKNEHAFIVNYLNPTLNDRLNTTRYTDAQKEVITFVRDKLFESDNNYHNERENDKKRHKQHINVPIRKDIHVYEIDMHEVTLLREKQMEQLRRATIKPVPPPHANVTPNTELDIQKRDIALASLQSQWNLKLKDSTQDPILRWEASSSGITCVSPGVNSLEGSRAANVVEEIAEAAGIKDIKPKIDSVTKARQWQFTTAQTELLSKFINSADKQEKVKSNLTERFPALENYLPDQFKLVSAKVKLAPLDRARTMNISTSPLPPPMSRATTATNTPSSSESRTPDRTDSPSGNRESEIAALRDARKRLLEPLGNKFGVQSTATVTSQVTPQVPKPPEASAAKPATAAPHRRR